MAPASVPLNSVYPGFYLDLGRVELPGVRSYGVAGCLKDGMWEGGGPVSSWETEENGPSAPKAHNLVTDIS